MLNCSSPTAPSPGRAAFGEHTWGAWIPVAFVVAASVALLVGGERHVRGAGVAAAAVAAATAVFWLSEG